MPKNKRPVDVNQLAASVVAQATGETQTEATGSVAATAGRQGGLKGGKARAAKLSQQERSDIAKTAAKARWDKAKSE